jgi:hypothetical protein
LNSVITSYVSIILKQTYKYIEKSTKNSTKEIFSLLHENDSEEYILIEQESLKEIFQSYLPIAFHVVQNSIEIRTKCLYNMLCFVELSEISFT